MTRARERLRARARIGGRTFLARVKSIFLGGVTMLVGAYRSVQETDLKRILAYSTVSALGLMTMLLGVGTRQAIAAAQRVGAHLIALASLRELADERAVTGAGGLYRLKSAGADGLAEIVIDAAGC